MAHERQKFYRECAGPRGERLLMVFTKHDSCDASGNSEWNSLVYYQKDTDVLGNAFWTPVEFSVTTKEAMLLQYYFEAVDSMDRWTMDKQEVTP